MSDIITWTTPDIDVVVEGYDLSDYQCTITLEQVTRSGSTVATVTVDASVVYDGTDSYVSATLTQAQTGKFRKGGAEVTVNAVSSDGERLATDPIPVTIGRNPVSEEVQWSEG